MTKKTAPRTLVGASSQGEAPGPATGLMVATTTYFGPDDIVITEGTIVTSDHQEPVLRPGYWKPVTPATTTTDDQNRKAHPC